MEVIQDNTPSVWYAIVGLGYCVLVIAFALRRERNRKMKLKVLTLLLDNIALVETCGGLCHTLHTLEWNTGNYIKYFRVLSKMLPPTNGINALYCWEPYLIGERQLWLKDQIHILSEQ